MHGAETAVDRSLRVLLVVSTLWLSWLAMMVVHEAGHVAHAWASGGTVREVVLHPLSISRTDLGRNPHPHFVVWGGPLWGCAIPLLVLLGARAFRTPYAFLFRFFAGFCLLANGMYIGAGSFVRAGDAGDLLRLGSPQWLLVALGAAASAGGLALWHGLGPAFGVGRPMGRIQRRAAIGTAAALVVLVAAELLLKAG